MPCHVDPDPDHPVHNPNRSHLTAYLCAIMKQLDQKGLTKEFLSELDEKESGVRAENLLRWWINHRAEDEKRKAAEAARKKRVETAMEATRRVRRELYEELKREFEGG